MKTSSPLKLRLNMSCLRLGVYDYLGFARQVVTKMKDNPHYLLPQPTLGLITVGLDDLQAKADDAVGGGRNHYIARNLSWHSSRMQVRELIHYVQLTGQNNPDILTSSGFALRKPVAPVGPLPAPQNPRARRNGKSGEVLLQLDPVRGVRAGYTVQQAENPDGPWVIIRTVSNVRSVLVTDLIPATIYSWRVRANGTAGPGPWSNTVSLMAT